MPHDRWSCIFQYIFPHTGAYDPVYVAFVLSCIPLLATPWIVAHQAPLSVEFSRQEYWSGLPFSSPGYLHDPGIKPSSVASPALEGRFFTTVPPGKPPNLCYRYPNKYRIWFYSYLHVFFRVPGSSNPLLY